MKNKFKLISILTPAILVAPIVTTISCSSENDVYVPVSQNDEATFDVGLTLDYAPYDFAISPLQYDLIQKQASTTDEIIGDGITKANANIYIEMLAPVKTGGYVGGFDVYLAKKIAEQKGQELVVHRRDFDHLLSGVVSKDFDAAMDGTSITDERKEIVNFSAPYIVAKNVLIYDAADNPNGITIDGIKDKKVGVIRGSMQNNIANDIAPIYGFTVVPLDTQYDVETAIKRNTVDLQIAENTAADLVAMNDERFGSITDISWVDANHTTRSLMNDINPTTDEIGIAFNKEVTDFTEVNNVITTTFPDATTRDNKFKQAEEMYSRFYYHKD